MNTQTDQQLLRDYAGQRSEMAFAELVRRHIDFVYSAALRMVRDTHLAEDVTQGVFVALAQNARQLADRAVLSGWLHRAAQNLAANAVRSDVRRRVREQEAATMNELLSSGPDVSWEHIAPQLDAAIGELTDSDRDALLLRYFERKSAREMAQILGLTDEAAQKRVNRAVERLRDYFSKRNVTIGAGGLVVVISANAIQAAPVGLAATVSAAAILTGTSVSTSTVIAATKIIAMTTLQKTVVTAVIAIVAGAGIYEAHQATQLKAEVQALQEQQAPLAEQLQQLQREHQDATNRLASLTDELAKKDDNNLELLKLRSEITALRNGQAAIPKPANPSPSTSIAARSTAPVPDQAGQELGRAVVRGDAGAFDKLLAETRAEHVAFNSNIVGLDEQQRHDASQRIFAPINEAFKIIGDAAAQGNRPALDALTQALQTPDLNGLAVNSLGGLAGNGDPGALEVLIHPDKYGALLSGTISALQPAADNGNQTAIDALAAVAKDQSDQPLWLMTANSLAKSAAAGNSTAIDALVNMSSTTNQNVQHAVAEGLKGAAANQNPKAAEALRAMEIQH